MKAKLLTAVGLISILAALSYLVRSARSTACEMSCRNTFKLIGLALLNYSDSNRTLPPAITLDANGQPQHSWRSQILNYVVAMQPIYDQDDHWDGPSNVRLMNGHVFRFDRPAEDTRGFGPYHGSIDLSQWFHCCAHTSKLEYSANVVVVTGPETLWPGTKTRQLSNMPDGAANTILIAETRSIDVYWSEPRDIHFNEMSFEINALSAPSISSHHPAGPAIVMADGSAYRLSPTTPPKIVRALLTYQGGETYTAEELVRDGYLIRNR